MSAGAGAGAGARARVDVVVVGGGVAGLVAALECARVGLRVLVLEQGPRVGGSIAPLSIAGVTVDAGAESFATRGGHVEAFLSELGLADAIVRPNPGGSWLHLTDGRTVPSPKAGLLGIPSTPLADDVRRVIGWRGAIRAYADRLMPVLKIGREHSLADLVEKRMGRAVLDQLVAPVTAGVYSARPEDIDIDIAAPGLNGALTRLGTLSGAVAELRANAPAGAAVQGIDGGMHRLVDALVGRIEYFGGVIQTDTAVLSVERAGAASGGAAGGPAGGPAGGRVDAAPDARGWVVRVGHEPGADAVAEAEHADPGRTTADAHQDADAASRASVAPSDRIELISARAVIVAVPELQALAALDGVITLDDALERAPRDLAVELVTLVIDDARLDAAPRGSGLLVVPGASDVVAKALTHATAKWAWLAETVAAASPAGAHRHVVRLSYGRVGEAHPLDGLTDVEAADVALRDASALLGVDLAKTAVIDTARVRWTNAVPLAASGQKARIDAVRAAVATHDGLEAVGTWLAGTGLASVIPDARTSAKRIRDHLLRLGVDIPAEEYDADGYAGSRGSPTE